MRALEQVVESLFRIGNQPPPSGQVPPRPENKRVWASLLEGKAAVIRRWPKRRDAVIRRASRRGWRSPMVSEPCQLRSRERSASLWIYWKFWKDSGTLRMSSHAEGSLEAELWVLDSAPCESCCEVSQVVKGIRRA